MFDRRTFGRNKRRGYKSLEHKIPPNLGAFPMKIFVSAFGQEFAVEMACMFWLIVLYSLSVSIFH
jgi:hypothetical protein